MTAERTKPCPDHASSNAIVARPSSAEAYHTGSLDVLNRATASVYLAILIKCCCLHVGLPSYTHQMDASSVLPESMKKSPRSLYSRPWEEAAPMRVWRLRIAATPRELWRIGGMGGPAPAGGLRFGPNIGLVPLRIRPVESSGWLLCAERRDNDSGSSTSDIGKSEGDGRDGNNDPFKYSLPNGLSRVLTWLHYFRTQARKRNGD